jgi:hypothetical protein
MAALTTQSIARAGTTPTFAAATGGGDTVQGGDNIFLVVKNGGGSPITATVVVPGTTAYGEANPDIAVAVANGAEKWIPMDSQYADNTTGRVSITYSGVTSVTVGAFQL